MTFIQAFNKIQERMSGNAKIATDKDFFAIQVELINKDCSGIFYIKYENGKLDIEPYDYYDNSVAISLSYLTFNKLIDGRIDLTSGIASGAINATGDLTAIDAISSIVPTEEKVIQKTAKKSDTSKPETIISEAAKPKAKKTQVKKTAPKADKSDSKKESVKKK